MTGYVIHGSDDRPLQFRGCAVPYREQIERDGRPEQFRYGSFAKNAAAGYPRVSLQWGHAADAVSVARTDGGLVIYETLSGLMFSAELDAGSESHAILEAAQSRPLGCSINAYFDKIADDGTVTEARLDHIAICPADETLYCTRCWFEEDSATRYDMARWDPEVLAWRQVLARAMRRAAMLEREAADEARARVRRARARGRAA